MLVLCFLYCFVYVYFLLVLSVVPPSDNSVAISDYDDYVVVDNNNNNNMSVFPFNAMAASDGT
jgi:hypothetical protein